MTVLSNGVTLNKLTRELTIAYIPEEFENQFPGVSQAFPIKLFNSPIFAECLKNRISTPYFVVVFDKGVLTSLQTSIVVEYMRLYTKEAFNSKGPGDLIQDKPLWDKVKKSYNEKDVEEVYALRAKTFHVEDSFFKF